MEVTKRKRGISVKGTIRENCYNCQTRLWESYRGGARFYYKYCSNCGKENNNTVKTKRSFLSNGLKMFLGWCVTIAIPSALAIMQINSVIHFSRKGAIHIFWAIIGLTLLWFLVYLLGFFLLKKCSNCGNPNCFRPDHYCYNCGKPL
jgi:predicted amidophosphoribosyltransferase